MSIMIVEPEVDRSICVHWCYVREIYWTEY